MPEDDEDGSTGYEHGTVRLEVAFLARGEDGQVYTPLRRGRAAWAGSPFGDDTREVAGVRARVIGLASLKAEKSQAHDDAVAVAKDSADLATLAGLG